MIKKVLLLLTVWLVVLNESYAQTRQISGVVKDTKGETLIGATVKVEDPSAPKSTQTGIDGDFKIAIPEGGATLTISYTGYQTATIKVTNQTTLDVVLQDAQTQLKEVVVIGYETIRRVDLTTATTSVTSETISAAPVSSALEALAGRASGVHITSSEGSPEAEMTVRVRGGGSLTQDNTPLYIVDGFPVESIADIAPQDIESIDVLKDAASTAIYGSRGANGVIIVTTKSGVEGKTSINFNAFSGVRHLADKLDVLEPYDYVLWQYERAILEGDKLSTRYTPYFGDFQDIDLYKGIASNDWQDLVFGRTGTTYNQNLSISGGTDKTKYSASHNYVKDKAIMQMSGYQRHNLNFKMNHKLYDRLSVDLGLRFSDTKIEGGGANEVNEKSSADSRLKYAMIYPTFPVPGLTLLDDDEDSDGNFALYHPLVAISDNDRLVQRKTYNLNAAVNYRVIENLRFRSQVDYNDYRNQSDRFYGATTFYVRQQVDAAYQGKPLLAIENTYRKSFRNTNTLNYDFKKILNKDHRLTWLLGQEFISTKENKENFESANFPTSFSFDEVRRFSGQGKPYITNNFFFPDDDLLSFFSRANYSYKGKYLLSASFRADGSSKFSEGNRWGYFPSASAAWRISSEDFMEQTKPWLDDLKLRFSYGAAGNNRIPAGQLIQEYQAFQDVYVNGGGSYWTPGTVMANPNLTWETTVTRNLGLDISMLKTKLNLTIDAYQNTTKDLLILFPIAGTGYESQYRNLGDTENKGLEFSLNYNAIRKENFDLSFNANISFNKNKIKSLGGLDQITGQFVNTNWASNQITQDYQAVVGRSIGEMYGYVSDGRYEVSDFAGYDGSSWQLNQGVPKSSTIIGNGNTNRPGDMKLKDINGDGFITEADRTVIGNAIPLHTGGFSVTSRIYNFDLAAYFNWSYGNDIYNANKIEYTSTGKFHSRNMITEMESGKRWTNLRPDGTISNDPVELEAMNANTTMWSPYVGNHIFSSYAVEDGSFLRLSTLTLGYTLPKDISKTLKMSKTRLYVSGYNLFKLTNYSGFDPEVSTRRKSPLTPGVDYSAYPRSRTFVFGLNVEF